MLLTVNSTHVLPLVHRILKDSVASPVLLRKIFIFFLNLCVFVSLSVSVPAESRRGSGSSGAGITGDFEPS